MGEIVAGAGVVALTGFAALMSIVLHFAYVIVPAAIVLWLLTLVPAHVWAQFRISSRTPAPIRVRSQR